MSARNYGIMLGVVVGALLIVGGLTYWYADIMRNTEPPDLAVMQSDAQTLRIQLAIERTRLDEAKTSQGWIRNRTRDSREVREIEARAEELSERLLALYGDLRQVEAGNNPAREAALEKMRTQIFAGLVILGFVLLLGVFLRYH